MGFSWQGDIQLGTTHPTADSSTLLKTSVVGRTLASCSEASNLVMRMTCLQLTPKQEAFVLTVQTIVLEASMSVTYNMQYDYVPARHTLLLHEQPPTAWVEVPAAGGTKWSWQLLVTYPVT